MVTALFGVLARPSPLPEATRDFKSVPALQPRGAGIAFKRPPLLRGCARSLFNHFTHDVRESGTGAGKPASHSPTNEKGRLIGLNYPEVPNLPPKDEFLRRFSPTSEHYLNLLK
jgi:hypothetical protein